MAIAGRKTALNDPDKGSWQYAYNALGELTRQRDGKSQALDFTYDALGRLTDRREKTGVTTITSTGGSIQNRETRTYKTSGNGIGQINTAVYRTGDAGTVLQQQSYSHDSFGRVTDVTTTLGTLTWTESSTYDQFSRPFQRFDASGDDRGERYHYQYGHLNRLQEAREGTLGIIYQEILDTDAWGNVTAFELGNGVEAFAGYEAQSGRLLNLAAYQGLTELQQVDYLFDVLGNLTQRWDRTGTLNLKETYGYDTLNRLGTVNLSVSGATAVTTLTLAYNAAGNITSKSDVGSYVYPAGTAARPHAVTSAGGVIYSYDQNGNQTSGNGRSITYTVFDQAASISKGTKKTEFAYGIGNVRYQRKDYTSNVLQKTTVYLGSVEYITEGASTVYKRTIGGVALADYYPSTGIQQTKYLLKDHLGSIHTVLNDTGQVLAREHFAAFGIRQDASNWQAVLTATQWASLNAMTTRGFTGHEHADDVGIIHMNGRSYDPVLGRFLQADPLVQAPKNSQSLNRYSYVLNNPLSYTDPSGYFSLSRFVKKWGRVIVAAVAAYFTFGATYAWAANAIATGASTSAGFAGFVASVGGVTAVTTTAAVVAGATAGFVSGAIVSGTFRGAVKGAFAGATVGGVGGFYGNTWNWGRVGAESLAGGVSAEFYGGEFEDGFKLAFALSTLTLANYHMRASERELSSINPDNTGKVSGGFFGDGTGMAGARRQFGPDGSYLPCRSPAGGCQGTPLSLKDQGNNFFGLSKEYARNSVPDVINESFAGPHDWFRNHVSRSYDPLGNGRVFSGVRLQFDRFANAALIPAAAPFAASALVMTQRYLYIGFQSDYWWSRGGD